MQSGSYIPLPPPAFSRSGFVQFFSLDTTLIIKPVFQRNITASVLFRAILHRNISKFTFRVFKLKIISSEMRLKNSGARHCTVLLKVFMCTFVHYGYKYLFENNSHTSPLMSTLFKDFRVQQCGPYGCTVKKNLGLGRTYYL